VPERLCHGTKRRKGKGPRSLRHSNASCEYHDGGGLDSSADRRVETGDPDGGQGEGRGGEVVVEVLAEEAAQPAEGREATFDGGGGGVAGG
jgi:hypothetical protein